MSATHWGSIIKFCFYLSWDSAPTWLDAHHFKRHFRFFFFGSLAFDLSVKVKGAVCCCDFWCKSCFTFSHRTIWVCKLWFGRLFFGRNDSPIKTGLPYGNNLPLPISAVRVCYPDEQPSLPWRGCAWRRLMNERFTPNQPTWRKAFAARPRPSVKINTKEKYCLRTQTWLLSDLLLLIRVWQVCGSVLLESFPL